MEFEGVAFAYGENLPFVLQDVDVALEPGTVTASWEIRAAARRRSPLDPSLLGSRFSRCA